MRELLLAPLFLLLLYSNSLFAALPPFYQSANEMVAILNNPNIAKLMGPYPIKNLTRLDDGSYMLIVEECRLNINIRYLPQKSGIIGGSAPFEIQLGIKECK